MYNYIYIYHHHPSKATFQGPYQNVMVGDKNHQYLPIQLQVASEWSSGGRLEWARGLKKLPLRRSGDQGAIDLVTETDMDIFVDLLVKVVISWFKYYIILLYMIWYVIIV